MKIKTSEAKDQVLDCLVAKCEGIETKNYSGALTIRYDGDWWQPSTDWAQGGPIIEREKIGFKYTGTGLEFVAWVNGELCTAHDQYGPTPLIAAMRCYVASKLGDEVEVPDDLK